MPSENYSFLDVAVLDAVRRRFAAGDAIAILSADLEQVIWANGPGAAVFGYPDIEAIIGASAQLPLIARRQIMATAGFPKIGSDRAITVRLATGMTSRAVGFLASAVTMPDGESAIILALPAAQTGSRSAADIAARAISGFNEDGHFIAFVDAAGTVEAASDGFAALAIRPETLAALVADVASQDDRIVKRLVPGGATSYPAGFARLTESRHLLVVIDEDHLREENPVGELDAEPAAARHDAGPTQAAPEDAVTADAVADQPAASGSQGAPLAVVPDVAEAAPRATEHDTSASTDTKADDRGQTGRSQAANDSAPVQHDHWYFHAGEEPQASEPDSPAQAEPESAVSAENALPDSAATSPTLPPNVTSPAAPPSAREIDRSAPPLRFVWRTDADGKFSALSPEFADIVGKPAADVIGRRFKDVATIFGLDASGEIAGLLERRDTWSGRSVLWPVAGSDLKIPVDLAALPVYGRSRAFEGFRGFGVARASDAVVDPEAIGMALVPNGVPPAAVEPATEETVAEAPKAADPFEGEVPALTIVPKQERRFADKVIRLAEHRQPANDKGLSTLERSAFREIGERLKKDNPPPEQPETSTPAEPAKPDQVAPAQAGPDHAKADQPKPDHVEVDQAETAAPAQQPEALSPDEIVPAATVEPSATAPESPTAETEPPESDAEDEKDLARLDGAQPGDVIADSEAGVKAPIVSRSLLDYADPEPGSVSGESTEATSSNSKSAPASEPNETSAQEIVETAAPQPADAGEDDSMTAADFRDAEDNEDWAPADEATGSAVQGGDRAGDADTAPAEPPRLKVPPLKLEGFVPSAFSAGDEHKAPDTSLLGKLPVPLLIHSGDELHYANEEFLGLTGYHTLEDLSDAGGLDALFADPYSEAADESDHALRLKTREGQEFPIEAILRSVPWRAGKALMLVVRRTGDDEAPVAAHVAAEEQTQPDVSELKSRIAEMRTIIDTATDGVVLIGRDGDIRSISRPAEALFGFDSDEVIGKPFASLFAIESQRAARDYLNGLSEPGVASVMNDGREVIGREAQGRFIPLFMTIGRLPNDSGFCAVVRDITQWKRAEEDLTQARAVAERASSQKTDFLARISHEIRTPLNAIIGFSELMVDEKFGPVANDRYRDYLRDINRSGNHVLDLVNDLLDISKIEAGQQEMDYEAVSLNDTLGETVAMMQPQANRERVIIRSSFASRLPEVVADLRSVRQIALNILSNAIRYTQAGGQVIVSTAYETSGDVVMRVRDTGIGMSHAEIEQALKPFKQINALKRGRGDGTGLGLPLTKAMVEANRARFTITSTPGEGTLVEVAFPSTRVLAE
ncbi:PAS domain S-box protein [Mesorhizobium sp. WSM4303]|uniref:PAS domain S-box protein n=1 Tax=unclassified Mesorhizobium TaxID=325217 RepID=UPI00115DBE9E|nr:MULTISPECIES: PAS domain S-box protein [unclassified Mesorhizobium]TRC89029.1 PAS domain S-box protein [Mesorhizobium sp. WSM4306]TRD01168.1 PAS domain S-box protein [Mesorhizobium sp. WSM4303]